MDLLQFVVERYNYWIFIVLMMTGLYTVIARGNLIKKIIGLNIFQTSVFIYYISIGKVVGGTAPIYVPGDMEARGGHHGDGHGDGHAAGHGGDHGDGHGEDHGADTSGDHNDAAHAGEADLHVGDANTLNHIDPSSHGGEADHTAANDLHAGAANAHLADEPHESADASHDIAFDIADHGGAEIVGNVLYSNPLPHVLILTAIVVGVATTAVGLALAVRIREAYGTIEEDELETADNIAEFGKADPRNGGTAGAGAA